MACDIVMDKRRNEPVGEFQSNLKIFGGRYYLLYRKTAGGFSRNIQEEKMNRKKVAKWLAAAGSLAVLTSCRGELVPYAAERTSEFLTAEPVILRDREAGRRFLMETVSAAEREGRQEIVVTGKRQLVLIRW